MLEGSGLKITLWSAEQLDTLLLFLILLFIEENEVEIDLRGSSNVSFDSSVDDEEENGCCECAEEENEKYCHDSRVCGHGEIGDRLLLVGLRVDVSRRGVGDSELGEERRDAW